MSARAGLYGLVAAETISVAGTRMSQLAVPWLVLTTTHSPIDTGLVSTAEIAPLVVLQILGSPLIDRLGGRRVALVGNLVAGAAMLGIPLLWHTGARSLPAVLGLVFIAGLARGPADSASAVLLPAVADQAGSTIDRATALFDGGARAANLVGALIAGVLIPTLGAANVVIVDGATFLAASALLVALVPVSAGHTQDGVDDPGGYLAQLREGFAFVRANPLMRSIAGMVFVTNLIDAAMSGQLVLQWGARHYGSTARIGVIVAVFGAGAVVGTLVVAAAGLRVPRRMAYAVGFLFAGAPRWIVLALPSPWWAVLTVWGLSGLGAGAINPVLSAAEYGAVPRPLQARVLGTVTALAWAGIPFGALLAGVVVDTAGLTTALVGGGAIYLVATAWPFIGPSWRLMDRRPEPDDAEANGEPRSTPGTRRRSDQPVDKQKHDQAGLCDTVPAPAQSQQGAARSMGTDRFLTLTDVADILNISASQTYALVRNGELPAIKIGGRGQWRVERDRLEEYIARMYTETSEFVAEHPFTELDASEAPTTRG